jgi:hypothetical protein
VANFIGGALLITLGLLLAYGLFYYHPIIAFVLLAIAAYWTVLKTGLADHVAWKNRQRAKDEAAQRERNAIAHEWQITDFVFPTREEFVDRVRIESSDTRLRSEVLRPILMHIGWLYEHSRLDNKHLSVERIREALEGLYRVSINAIRAFAREAPQLLEPKIVSNTLFEAKRTLAQLVGDEPSVALERAYTALAKEFGKCQSYWRQPNLMDVDCGPVDSKISRRTGTPTSICTSRRATTGPRRKWTR